MIKNQTIDTNALLVSRLAIERCQAHLAHLHALMHLCEPGPMGNRDSLVAESFQSTDSSTWAPRRWAIAFAFSAQ